MNDTSKRPERNDWVAPTIRDAGTIADILKGGGGKFSIDAPDTGDARKPKGQG